MANIENGTSNYVEVVFHPPRNTVTKNRIRVTDLGGLRRKIEYFGQRDHKGSGMYEEVLGLYDATAEEERAYRCIWPSRALIRGRPVISSKGTYNGSDVSSRRSKSLPREIQRAIDKGLVGASLLALDEQYPRIIRWPTGVEILGVYKNGEQVDLTLTPDEIRFDASFFRDLLANARRAVVTE